jgi:resuscitation-promoting factor RpfA
MEEKVKRTIHVISIATTDVAAIVLLYPGWSSLWAGVRDPQAWVAREGADFVISTIATTALWAVSLWLGLGLLAAFGAALPGTAGTVARTLLELAVPAVVHRALAGALGLGVLAAPVTALASPGPSPSATISTSSTAGTLVTPIWPSGSPGRATAPVPTPGWPVNGRSMPSPGPAASPPVPQPPDREPPPPANRSVIVRPGDSLWLIASQRLGQRAQARQVAAAWPRWYAANRAEIGPDPNLIRAGQILHAPNAPEPSR